MEEGLYIVKFGFPTWYAAGVIVLETLRFFGGDSIYYYVGDYKVDGKKFHATGRVVLHTPVPGAVTIFGDPSPAIEIIAAGDIDAEGRKITGMMSRRANPIPTLPIELTFREKLPG